MRKAISSSNSSLPLHEVLEAEFKALHGELPRDYPTSSQPETKLKALWAAIHGLKEKRSALCISGGGIRSATFGLGILQGLARCGLLDKFHYLSTVSGGGYPLVPFSRPCGMVGCVPFPHESTADQFFSESQFESYRMPGCWVKAARIAQNFAINV
jgi:hypothetical protein